MTTDTIGSERATNTVQIIQAKPDSIMNLSEAQKLERKQAEESDYYNVLLWDEAARRQVRVRTCCWVLDAERKPVTNEDGKRPEEHTSELQSLMRISYAVFCLK